MKKIHYVVLFGLSLVMLAWCGQKTMMQVSFDAYTFQRNTNGKIYAAKANQPWSITRYQAQQVTTGKANSLIVSQMLLSSGNALLDVVKLNTDQLGKKLLNYKWSSPSKKNSTCRWMNMTWYATTFTYDLDTETFHAYQYYFMQGNTLYLISFQADNSKDVSAMAKSIASLTCK